MLDAGPEMRPGGGVFLDDGELFSRLENVGECVMKRSRDTSSGRDVFIVNMENGVDLESGKPLSDVLKRMGDDWVCQERVVQHENVAALYGGSVNTLRIVTYLTNSGVGVCPVTLRLGQGGSKVDNAHAGGMFVSVDNEGHLGAEAFTEYQERFSHHPDTGIAFEGYRIEGVGKAIEAAKRSHLVMGSFGFVSWDVCIDESATPVLIEVNLDSQTVWFPQMASGRSMFGDDTEAVFSDYWSRKVSG